MGQSGLTGAYPVSLTLGGGSDEGWVLMKASASVISVWTVTGYGSWPSANHGVQEELAALSL